MKTVVGVSDWLEIRKNLRGSIGFVPTMGALHLGHASLLKKSRQENEISVLSIFVNPTQFNDKKDFEKYPNTIESDQKLSESCGVDYLLFPNANEIYKDD